MLDFQEFNDFRNTVSYKIVIHVRLTDFNQIDKNPLNSSYYNQALAEIRSHTQNSPIVCFSDDIATAREILNQIPNLEFPEEMEEFRPDILLFHLSSAQTLICSKSSLCWWAGQVVIANGGKVISPFNHNLQNEEWVTISQN